MINIINDANELRYKIENLELVLTKMEDYVINQRKQIVTLEKQLSIQKEIDEACANRNIELTNENTDLKEDLAKSKQKTKTFFWTTVILGGVVGLFIVAN